MSLSNLPPGVTEHDIPGYDAEDVVLYDWECPSCETNHHEVEAVREPGMSRWDWTDMVVCPSCMAEVEEEGHYDEEPAAPEPPPNWEP